MLRSFGSFLNKNVLSPLKNARAEELTKEDADKLNIFLEILNSAYQSKGQGNTKAFVRMIDIFASTFLDYDKKYRHNPDVKSALSKFCGVCATMGIAIIENKDVVRKMLDSLTFASKFFTNFPHAVEFMPLFSHIIQQLKSDQLNLSIYKSFLEVLFKTETFFTEFNQSDGFSMVFNTFYMRPEYFECQQFFIDFLFCCLPLDFFRLSQENSTLLQHFVSVVSNTDSTPITYKTAILYLVKYLAAFIKSNSALFLDFTKYDGFDLINTIMIEKCPETALEAYEALLIASDINPIAVTSLHKYYLNSDLSPEIRSSLVDLLSVSTKGMADTCKKITSAVPLGNWILPPPHLTYNGLQKICYLLSDLSKKNIYPVSNTIPSFLKYIAPPPNKDIPVMEFIDLMADGIAHGNVTPQLLISNKFVEYFLFIPSCKDILPYFTTTKSFTSVMGNVFMSPDFESYRFSIFEKLLSDSDELILVDNFVNFIGASLGHCFSIEMIKLMKLFMKSEKIFTQFAIQVEKKIESFDVFMESGSFDQFEGEDPKLVVLMLKALTKFGPHNEIDIWINSLPNDHPIFQVDPKILENCAIGKAGLLQIPSLLVFCDGFNDDSPLNLYLAGKYGLKNYVKFNKNLGDVPHINGIANRFVRPALRNELIKYPKLFHMLIDPGVSPFSVFEFIPEHGPATLQIQSPFVAVSFWFKVTEDISHIPIFSCNGASIIYEENSLDVSSSIEKATLHILPGRWHHISINLIATLKRLKRTEVSLNGIVVAKLKTKDEEAPLSFTFGGDKMGGRFFVSKAIFLSEINFTQQQIDVLSSRGPGNLTPLPGLKTGLFTHSPAVFDVPYHGMVSYYRDFVQLESLFKLMEDSKDGEELNSLFVGLTALQTHNQLPLKKFWQRMLEAMDKCTHLVEERFDYFFYGHCNGSYGDAKQQKIYRIIMDRIDFYFRYQPLLVTKWLQRVFSRPDYEAFEGFESTAYCLIRSGVNIEISKSLIWVLSKLVLVNSGIEKLRTMFNFSLTVTEYGLKDIQKTFLKTVFRILTNHVTGELNAYPQMLDLMYILKDEDLAIIVAQLIAFYSSSNDQYITQSTFSNIFARYCESTEMWCVVFAILRGTMEFEIPFKFTVKRRYFVPAAMSMLASLFAKTVCALNENPDFNTDFVEKIVTAFIGIDNFAFFATKACAPIFYQLTNLGLIPPSYESNKGGGRSAQTLPKKTIQLGLKDSSNIEGLFESSIDNEYLRSKFENTEEIPVEISLSKEIPADSPAMVQLMTKTQLPTLIADIALAAEPSSMQNQFIELASGNALMYSTYRREFAREIVFALLTQVTVNKCDSAYKPLILLVHHSAVRSLFADRYEPLLSLLFNFLRSANNFAVLMEDPDIVSAYREILLCAYVFTSDEYDSLYQLINMNQSVVFHQSVFADQTFAQFWTHINKHQKGSANGIACMGYFMNLVGSTALANYKSEEVENQWGLYRTHMLHGEDESEQKQRVSRMNTVLDYYVHYLVLLQKHDACTKAFIELESEIHRSTNNEFLSNYLRRCERNIFEAKLRAFKLKLQTKLCTESKRLSPLIFPVHDPRVVMPSPFKLPDPQFDATVPAEFFYSKYEQKELPIPYLSNNTKLETNPGLYQFGVLGEGIFDYSISLSNDSIKEFESAFSEFGPFSSRHSIFMYYYIHELPSVLFISENFLIILVLAEFDGKTLNMDIEPKGPVAFLPLSESVAVGDYPHASLFRGHIVLFLHMESLMLVRQHSYVHRKVCLSLFTMTEPNTIIGFESDRECIAVERLLKKFTKNNLSMLPSQHFLACVPSAAAAQTIWSEGIINNHDYLLLLNLFGGRSFTDLTQYPVFPWTESPSLVPRDLTKPMGQLSESRAAHYEQTYELSDPPYHYGFHYSLPGAIFWFLVRVPPFCYFCWDLNAGWDDPLRMFASIEDAYKSASGANPSDLKEFIPQMLSVPSAYRNDAQLSLHGLLPDSVALPEWANGNALVFSQTLSKHLNEVDIAPWTDLIFGFQQTGEAAIEAKNVFLPTSYHSATPKKLDMLDDVFESQTINFGQCPFQLFTKPHPPKPPETDLTAIEWSGGLTVKPLKASKDKRAPRPAFILDEVKHIPASAAVYGAFIITTERENEALVVVDSVTGRYVLAMHSPTFSFVSHLSITPDGLFMAVSYSLGRADVIALRYKNGTPSDLRSMGMILRSTPCIGSSIASRDLVCCSNFGEEIVLWSIVTNQLISIIKGRYNAVDFANEFFTASGPDGIIEISTSGEILSECKLEEDPSCLACISSGPGFHRRIVSIGTVGGKLEIRGLNDSLKSQILSNLKISKYPLVSMSAIGGKAPKIVVADSKGFTYQVEFDPRINRCIQCGALTCQKCYQCQRPICRDCITGPTLCRECSDNMSLSTGIM